MNSESPKYLRDLADKTCPPEYIHPQAVMDHAAKLCAIADEIELLEKHGDGQAEKRYDDAQEHDAEIKALQSKLDEARKLLYEAYPWTSSDLQKAMDAVLPKKWCDAYSASRPKPEAPK